LNRLEKELRNAKEAISSLEKEKLATVDRFRPATDRDVMNAFNQLQTKAKMLSNFLARQMRSDLQESEWVACMIKHTWAFAYAPDVFEIDPKQNADFRKQIWRLVVWHWLDENIIRRPFSSYGGPSDYPESLDACYEALFPNPEELTALHHPGTLLLHFLITLADRA
jgi:hypothetical protein